jgi:hypothetical protein
MESSGILLATSISIASRVPIKTLEIVENGRKKWEKMTHRFRFTHPKRDQNKKAFPLSGEGFDDHGNET